MLPGGEAPADAHGEDNGDAPAGLPALGLRLGRLPSSNYYPQLGGWGKRGSERLRDRPACGVNPVCPSSHAWFPCYLVAAVRLSSHIRTGGSC